MDKRALNLTLAYFLRTPLTVCVCVYVSMERGREVGRELCARTTWLYYFLCAWLTIHYIKCIILTILKCTAQWH